jgi:hypothetical protein
MVTVGNIIENRIVSKMENVLEIVSFTNETDGFSYVIFEDLKYIRLYKYILINDEQYEFSIIDNHTLRIEGSVNFNTEIKLPIPPFFQGTLSNTKFEWERFSNKEADKLPFIWLNSPEDERIDISGNGGTSEVQIEVWFVHHSNWKKKNSDRINESIEPLRSLVREFMRKVDHRFPPYDNFSLRNFPKFVDEQNNKLVFSSELSAVQLNMNIRFYPYNCTNF